MGHLDLILVIKLNCILKNPINFIKVGKHFIEIEFV